MIILIHSVTAQSKCSLNSGRMFWSQFWSQRCSPLFRRFLRKTCSFPWSLGKSENSICTDGTNTQILKYCIFFKEFLKFFYIPCPSPWAVPRGQPSLWRSGRSPRVSPAHPNFKQSRELRTTWKCYTDQVSFLVGSTHHWKCIAQTGRQHPNMSTTFMGRSRPLEDLCKQTPRSAEPVEVLTLSQVWTRART